MQVGAVFLPLNTAYKFDEDESNLQLMIRQPGQHTLGELIESFCDGLYLVEQACR